MKMRKYALAGVLALGLISTQAATTTTTVSLLTTAYTDLGVGPIYLGAKGGAIDYKIADSQPVDLSDAGSGVVYPGGKAELLSTTAHVWARAALTGASAVVTSGDGVTPGVTDRSNATNAPGYCQISVPTTAGGATLTAMLATAAALAAGAGGGTCAVPTWTTWAYFRPATAGTAVIRCAADSTTLSATLGFPLDGLTDFPMPGGVQGATPFSTLKCQSTGGSAVTVDIEWMG